MDEAEDTVEAGEDFLDVFGRIIVNVVEVVVLVEMFAPAKNETTLSLPKFYLNNKTEHCQIYC